ncbi:PHD finger protein ALFIN-LIKE 9 [Camellia lanceoleosa]|uniref:PHD finger protein ALFIN-LIKE 9 n=1 Tax=Camellia lanceoleosa TaxID=1840588 RepID=A0ACC0G599_9ERIC|nr:PHD finger protein ALFIN-LIKE 9 [Camellia lanceoleosa]
MEARKKTSKDKGKKLISQASQPALRIQSFKNIDKEDEDGIIEVLKKHPLGAAICVSAKLRKYKKGIYEEPNEILTEVANHSRLLMGCGMIRRRERISRDGMQEKDWLAVVVVHSDAWLLAVAFYFGARFGFDKADSLDGSSILEISERIRNGFVDLFYEYRSDSSDSMSSIALVSENSSSSSSQLLVGSSKQESLAAFHACPEWLRIKEAAEKARDAATLEGDEIGELTCSKLLEALEQIFVFF